MAIPTRARAIGAWLVAAACGGAPSVADDGDGSSSAADAGTAGTAGSASAGTTAAGDDSSSGPPTTTAGTTMSTTSSDDGSSDGGDETGPPPVLGACDSLAGEGVFEDITPPEVAAGFGQGQDAGTFAFAVDPVNQGTIYLGTLFQKVWKSTDCGATWVHISTGENGDAVDSGMNWTFAIDPIEPEVVYTNSGYGANGLFKSIDGGVDWAPVWPPPAQPELGAAFTYNFANVIAIDPTDHEHILLTFHESCLPPHPATCIAESHDAGASWSLIDGEPSWDGNEGQVIFFLDAQTWLWGSQSNGFWRSDDGGDSWEAIVGMTTSHLQGSQLVRTPGGAFVVAGADGIWRSTDGTVPTWSLIEGTGPIVGGVVSDGATLYTSTCYFGGFCETARYLRSVDDGVTWTEFDAPSLSMGGSFGYDPGHGVLYSSNLQEGFWRVVVKP
ncbi:MAG: hypothetical protein IPK74_27890 [Deltaproteobacteria bacterium]|nr:hypothetical protein [Deltaproteobacteria bacterium]